ncbi:MAG: hypothetical protein AB1758_00535 [Candidatus Eremiobacterota bacterium]
MNVDTPVLDTAGRRLLNAARPHLPAQVDPSGVGSARLLEGCDRFLNTAGSGSPSENPYGDMPTGQAVDATREIREFARGAQAEFANKVGNPQAQITVGQLQTLVQQVQNENQVRFDELQGQKDDLKGNYNRKVVKTVAWMGVTAGTLVLGGIFPNPVTGILIAGAGAMAIRSLGQARTAQKALSDWSSANEQNLRASRQLVADAGFYGPLLAGWNDLLGAGTQPKAA